MNLGGGGTYSKKLVIINIGSKKDVREGEHKLQDKTD